MERDDPTIERMLGRGGAASVDTEAALRRFADRAAAARAASRARPWLRPLAAAATVAAVLALGAATGVAETVITVFQPKQVAPVAVRVGDVSGIPDLRDLGTLTWREKPEQRQEPTLDAAQRATGIAPLRPGAGAPVSGEPRIYTVSRAEATFAFDEARLRASAGRVQRTPPPLPAAIAASTLTLSGGPAVVQTWGGPLDPDARPERLPRLLIAQSRAPLVTSNGATVEELRRYALSQPGLSPDLERQLRAIGDPAQTLLVPVPIDLATGRAVAVRGTQGVLVGDQTGLGSALFWVADGIVHVVAGTLPDTELVAIANALR